MPTRIRARVGDVFSIPVLDHERVLGQVVDQAGPQFMVVTFRSDDPAPEKVVAAEIDLAGIIFDAKLRNGDWPILSNQPPATVSEPWFLVGHSGLGNLRLESFDGSKVRAATSADAAEHAHRNISSPMAFQWAVEAARGHREWTPALEIFPRLGRELGRP